MAGGDDGDFDGKFIVGDEKITGEDDDGEMVIELIEDEMGGKDDGRMAVGLTRDNSEMTQGE